MKTQSILISFYCIFYLSACRSPVVDSSSEVNLTQSVERVRDSLPEDQRSAFLNALKIISMDQINQIQDAETFEEQVNRAGVNIRELLDGKSAAEILTIAEAIRKSDPGQYDEL